MKKLAAFAGATVINFQLAILSGHFSRWLRLPEDAFPFYILGCVLLWYGVFAALFFLASREDHPMPQRVGRALGESAIAILIFFVMLTLPIARLG